MQQQTNNRISTLKPPIFRLPLLNKKGFGTILLYCIIPITPLLAMFKAFSKNKQVTLAKVPKVLTSRGSLGSIVGWGIFLMIYGFTATYGALAILIEGDGDFTDILMIAINTLPIAITGIAMLRYNAKYDRYMAQMDKMLIRIEADPVIRKGSCMPIVTKSTTNAEAFTEVRRMLADLKLHSAIAYTESISSQAGSEDSVTVTWISNGLAELYNMGMGPLGKGKQRATIQEWTCRNCGAINTSMICEYCGTKASRVKAN